MYVYNFVTLSITFKETFEQLSFMKTRKLAYVTYKSHFKKVKIKLRWFRKQIYSIDAYTDNYLPSPFSKTSLSSASKLFSANWLCYDPIERLHKVVAMRRFSYLTLSPLATAI